MLSSPFALYRLKGPSRDKWVKVLPGAWVNILPAQRPTPDPSKLPIKKINPRQCPLLASFAFSGETRVPGPKPTSNWPKRMVSFRCVLV